MKCERVCVCCLRAKCADGVSHLLSRFRPGPTAASNPAHHVVAVDSGAGAVTATGRLGETPCCRRQLYAEGSRAHPSRTHDATAASPATGHNQPLGRPGSRSFTNPAACIAALWPSKKLCQHGRVCHARLSARGPLQLCSPRPNPVPCAYLQVHGVMPARALDCALRSSTSNRRSSSTSTTSSRPGEPTCPSHCSWTSLSTHRQHPACARGRRTRDARARRA
jgi:hypothetical protein